MRWNELLQEMRGRNHPKWNGEEQMVKGEE
jgi:hypothetical protein